MKSILQNFKKFVRPLVNNIGLKLLSILLAIGLWAFVMNTDATVTRNRTFTDLYVTAVNQETLDNRGLALTDTLTDAVPRARVSVSVNQNDYHKLNNNNIRVELDLSAIHGTGEQTVPLIATTVYGEIAEVYPETVTLRVEELSIRPVSVEVRVSGRDEETYWYASPASDPSVITVTGPKSVVNRIVSACADLDMTGLEGPTVTRVLPIRMLDTDGAEIAGSNVRLSANTVVAGASFYPIAQIPVEDDTAKLLNGSLPAGYYIDHVEIEPENVTIAGSPRFLSSLKTVPVYSINISDMTETTTKSVRVIRQSEMHYVSHDQVMVTIYVEEKELTRTFENVRVAVTNVGEGLDASCNETCTVTVTGPFNAVSALRLDDLDIHADAFGCEEGSFTLDVESGLSSDDSLAVAIAPAEISVSLEADD